MKACLLALLCFLGVAGSASAAAKSGYADRPQAKALIEYLQSEHGLDPDWVRARLARAVHQPDIIAAMRRPAERVLAWHEYREIFLDRARITGGVAFIRAHEDIFCRAQEQFGVPAPIIAAIIGVETRYGAITGDERVLDTLATLGFDYPPRAEFFRSELGEFLVLAHEEDIRVRQVTGSYAGAMGMPQFIASSYRYYAVDFDDDGRRDLWGSTADVIGSVANYLAEHDWQAGAGVARPARITGPGVAALQPSRRATRYQYRDLVAHGLEVAKNPPPPATPVGVVELEGAGGPQYWVGLQNFFVITSYNHSPLYAMAVHQLATAIAAGLDQTDPP